MNCRLPACCLIFEVIHNFQYASYGPKSLYQRATYYSKEDDQLWWFFKLVYSNRWHYPQGWLRSGIEVSDTPHKQSSHQLFQLLGKRPYTNSSSFWLEIDDTSVCVLISLSNNPMVPLLISNSKKIHSVFMLLNNRVGLVPLFNDMESSEFPRWNAIVLVFPLPCQNYRMGSFCIFVGFSLFWRDIHNNIPFWLRDPEIQETVSYKTRHPFE